MKKIMFCFLCSWFLMGATQCAPSDKYQAQNVEDCHLLTTWVAAANMDWTSCYCVDQNIKDANGFTTILVPRVKGNMSDHPLAAAALSYIQTNQATIIKNHQYELPAQYCRGYSMTNPQARVDLTNWSEGNRTARIKCESGVQ